MECLYHPELKKSSSEVLIDGEEFRHARALRLREGQQVVLSNGNGLVAVGRVGALQRNHISVHVESLQAGYGEEKQQHVLALGLLQSRERFEFALEKAVELGVGAIQPLLTDHGQQPRMRRERLEQKLLAAMKQSRRAFLPELMELQDVATVLKTAPQKYVILCDAEGERSLPAIDAPALLMLGPEGGFSEEERQQIRQDSRTLTLNLGPRRLRAETAAVAALVLVNAATID